METFLGLPDSIAGWIGIIGVIVVGGVAVWGLIDKAMRDRRKDAIDAADDVIVVLKEKVEILEKKVKTLEDEQSVHIKQITELRATNETLTKILQGRDDRTLDFQRVVIESTQNVAEIHEIVKATEGHLANLADAIQKLIECKK